MEKVIILHTSANNVFSMLKANAFTLLFIPLSFLFEHFHDIVMLKPRWIIIGILISELPYYILMLNYFINCKRDKIYLIEDVKGVLLLERKGVNQEKIIKIRKYSAVINKKEGMWYFSWVSRFIFYMEFSLENKETIKIPSFYFSQDCQLFLSTKHNYSEEFKFYPIIINN